MANLTEHQQWDNVYQIETTDPVLGGPGGIANRQPQELVNRTAYLKGLADGLADAITALGTGKQDADAALTAISGLATAADRLAYFSGADQAALTTLTAFARTMLDDADAATARGTLGISTAIADALAAITTPGQFDNDTSIATTAFVQRALGSRQSSGIISSSVTLTAADVGKSIVAHGAATIAITLPLLSDVADGSVIEIRSLSQNPVLVQRQGTNVIGADNANNALTSIMLADGDSAVLVKFSSTSWILISGSASLRYSSGDFGKSLTATGYQKLPSGLILQWGTDGGRSSEGTTTVTFPITFPTSVMQVIAGTGTDNSVAIGPDVVVQVKSYSVTGATFVHNSVSTATGPSYGRYVAIGY